MTIVADSRPVVMAALVLRAERARHEAETHRALCRYRAQGLVCSTCFDLDERAALRARVAGQVA